MEKLDREPPEAGLEISEYLGLQRHRKQRRDQTQEGGKAEAHIQKQADEH
jgi:hypothetical protein